MMTNIKINSGVITVSQFNPYKQNILRLFWYDDIFQISSSKEFKYVSISFSWKIVDNISQICMKYKTEI